MNHKGTESRRKKSLVLNQALILHDKWESFGLDSCLILLLSHCPRDVMCLQQGCLEPSRGQGQEQRAQSSWGAVPGLPSSTPALLGLPQAQHATGKLSSKLLQGLWNTCSGDLGLLCPGLTQVRALARG